MDMMINEEIRDREIRLIGPEGEQLGIMSARQALDIAEEKELDLVKIAPTAKPPVCKLMDYGSAEEPEGHLCQGGSPFPHHRGARHAGPRARLRQVPSERRSG